MCVCVSLWLLCRPSRVTSSVVSLPTRREHSITSRLVPLSHFSGRLEKNSAYLCVCVCVSASVTECVSPRTEFVCVCVTECVSVCVTEFVCVCV